MMKNEMKLSMDAISENEALGRICIATFLTRLHPTLEELEDVKTAGSDYKCDHTWSACRRKSIHNMQMRKRYLSCGD